MVIRFGPHNEAGGMPEQPDETPSALPETSADDSKESDNSPMRTLLRWVVVTVLCLILIRAFVITPYSIPTGSMFPTIHRGDAILVNTFCYYLRTPDRIPFTNIDIPQLEMPGPCSLERGDVVVFKATEHRRSYGGSDQLVKRCVALAGDTVQIAGGRLLVNGSTPYRKGAGEPMNPDRVYELLQNNRKVIVPYKGYRLILDSARVEAWRPVIESEGVSVDYRNSIVFLNGRPATYYRFRQDYFFAAGDNSGDSYDSRFFGFVPQHNLIGQGMFVYWSRSPFGEIRWGRLGTWIR